MKIAGHRTQRWMHAVAVAGILLGFPCLVRAANSPSLDEMCLGQLAASGAEVDEALDGAPSPVTIIAGEVSKVETNATDAVVSPTVLDSALQRIRRGETLSEGERLRCREALSQYFDDLCREHKKALNSEFPEPDRTQFYIAAVKTGIVDWEGNGGWPFRSALRLCVFDQLKKTIETTNDPFIPFCTIFPALYANQKDYAVKSFETVKKCDDFLAMLTVKWSIERYREPDWLITYYMTHGQQDRAKEVAEMAGATGLRVGLEMKGCLLEQLGQYAKAEACYIEVQKRHDFIGPLVGFYIRFRDQKDDKGIPFSRLYEELTEHCFPKGLRKVELSDFSGPPTNGAVFMGESRMMREYGVRQGMVVSALDAYRVENLMQYYFIRELDASNPQMSLIIWNGVQYTNITARLKNRRFGVELKTYEK